MTQGVIFYNEGTKLLVRLIVAIHSLKKHYSGDITLISIGKESNDYCEHIAKALKVNLKIINRTDEKLDKHACFLEKSRMHLHSPYDVTLFLDSDVVVVKPIDELFDMIRESKFIVPHFSDWMTRKGTIKKRLLHWQEQYPEDVKKVLDGNYPSVNVGVFGFAKDSELMKAWYDYTIKNYKAKLPEETSCHLLLLKYPGKVVNSKYNYSCKHDRSSDPVIIHYHGRKHCRVENGVPKFNADKWIAEYEECLKINYVNMSAWQLNIGDKALKQYIKGETPEEDEDDE